MKNLVHRIKSAPGPFVRKWAVCLSFLIMFGFASIAHAGSYVGEFKWEIIPEGDGPQTLITGITYMGDRYFLVQGYLTPTNGDGVVVCNGSAVIMDNKILMSLNVSHQHTTSHYRDIQTLRIEIDSLTMNGTMWGLGISYNISSKEFDLDDYVQGTVRLIGP